MISSQTQYLPKGDESSWQKHTRFAARNATTIKTLIVTAKTNMGTRNIFDAYAGINLRRMPLRPAGVGDRTFVLIRSALSAGRPCSSTTTTNIAQIAAVTKDVIIPSSCQKQPTSQRLQSSCESCAECQTYPGPELPRRHTNNLIECFNKQFKAWYKPSRGSLLSIPPTTSSRFSFSSTISSAPISHSTALSRPRLSAFNFQPKANTSFCSSLDEIIRPSKLFFHVYFTEPFLFHLLLYYRL